MKKTTSILWALLGLLLLLAPVSASLGDKWAITDGGNDVWHITSAGVLKGGASCGGFEQSKLSFTTLASNTTLTSTSAENYFVSNMTATVTLPSAVLSPGKPFSFKANTATAGNISIASTAGTIDGASTVNITTRGYLEVVSDGTNWQILKR